MAWGLRQKDEAVQLLGPKERDFKERRTARRMCWKVHLLT